jgi:hypothetical protein
MISLASMNGDATRFTLDAQAMDFATVTTSDLEVGGLNETLGDLLFDRLGDAVVATDKDAIVGHIRVRLRFLQGECVFDQRLGFPYRQVVFVKSPNLDLIRSLLRETIEGTPGVEAVTDLKLTHDRRARTLAVSFRATTTVNGVIDSSEYAPFLLEAA